LVWQFDHLINGVGGAEFFGESVMKKAMTV